MPLKRKGMTYAPACNLYCTDLDHVGAASPDIPMDKRNTDTLHVVDEYTELELGAQDDQAETPNQMTKPARTRIQSIKTVETAMRARTVRTGRCRPQ